MARLELSGPLILRHSHRRLGLPDFALRSSPPASADRRRERWSPHLRTPLVGILRGVLRPPMRGGLGAADASERSCTTRIHPTRGRGGGGDRERSTGGGGS